MANTAHYGQTVYDGEIGDHIAKLAEEWRNGCGPSSSPIELARHPAYQAIVEMGAQAVPFILRELEREPDWWFVALNRITGADPVPEEDRGRLDAMTCDWLDWAKLQGYRW